MPRKAYADRVYSELRRLIDAGLGQGHGPQYQPVIQITRSSLLPDSYAVLKPLPMLGRTGHFLSMNEWMVALFLLWLHVIDLREQYPIWPWAHPHPLYGRCDYRPAVVPMSAGLLKIAADLNIAHGTVAGASLPYIGNEDIIVTVPRGRLPEAVMFSVKPEDKLTNHSLQPRDVERLLLAKTYAHQLDMRWFLLSQADIPATLVANLDGLERRSVPYCDRISELSLRFPDLLEQQFDFGRELGYARNSLSSRLKLAKQEFDWLLGHAIWHRRISLDPRVPWDFSETVERTDFGWVERTRRHLFGEAA